MQYTLYNIRYTIYRIQYTIDSIKYTAYDIQYTVIQMREDFDINLPLIFMLKESEGKLRSSERANGKNRNVGKQHSLRIQNLNSP